MFATILGKGTCFTVCAHNSCDDEVNKEFTFVKVESWSYAKKGNHILTCGDDYTGRYIGDVSSNGSPNLKGIYID
jgi:hypothetical protein